ncbi:MAG: prepilin-type N-terminal cleavage/methylation domain-containing protein [Helicobacteraceae bacterium]|jgi:prepilin-type N-terminal cleavage/methylation domain-containing protein|nr:prepilin-type N-terminal cleavage/methylation domain-containing protein [Helicobacteraceae bacterium]
MIRLFAPARRARLNLEGGGFTLIEAIITIMIAGILSMIAYAVFYEPDKLALARDQIIRHLRYTQHLAVMDDKFDPNDPNWELKRWRLKFSTSANPIYAGGKAGGWTYTIFADQDRNASNTSSLEEMAVDPLTKRRLSGGVPSRLRSDRPDFTPEMALWYWRVERLDLHGCLQTIAFDEIGRPFHLYNTSSSTTVKRPMLATCKITLIGESGEQASLCIALETGRVSEC